MLSRRVDAFDDAALDEAAGRQALYQRARELLDRQAAALIEAGSDPIAPRSAAHATYDPHRRPLSSAARRLIRAHEKVEESAEG